MSSVRTLAYRADIDGLRAVAVLSVLAFHLNRDWLPGGFTGVDIFFVISGFLITRIIGREMELGTFSFKKFYVRRIRRILPVSNTVLLTTLAVGTVVLLPSDLRGLLRSVEAAVFFTANLYFAKDQGYFTLAADEKPLLHYWSLSVEEQYYFLWPLLLWAFYALGSRFFHQPKTLHQKATIFFTSLLILLGLAVTQFALIANPGQARWYFLLSTRFCELMLGALTALLPLRHHHPAITEFQAIAGVGLIGLGFGLLTEHSLFPGLNSLFPCLGAALLIASGEPQAFVKPPRIHRALAAKPVVGLGLLSYSLYLWHWPILAYLRYVYGTYDLKMPVQLFALSLTFGLSILSYRFIEGPTRHLRLSFSKAFLGVFLLPALFITGLCHGLKAWYPIVALPADLLNYGRDLNDGNLQTLKLRGDLTKPPTVLVVGDSQAAALNGFIDVVGKHEGWSAHVLTASSCSPVFGFNELTLPSWAQTPCAQLKTFVAQHYKDYQAIVFASYWAYQLGLTDRACDPKYASKLQFTLRTMADERPIYVLSSLPTLAVSPLRAQHLTQRGLHITRPLPQEPQQANALVRSIVTSIPGCTWVNLDEAYAHFTDGGLYQSKPAYFDPEHLNVYGARALGQIFIKSGQTLIGSLPSTAKP